jgi:hypothetical protein
LGRARIRSTKRSVFESGEKVLKQAKAAGTLPARKPKGPADLYRRKLYPGPRLMITSSRRRLAGLAWVPLCDSNYERSPMGQFCMIRISRRRKIGPTGPRMGRRCTSPPGGTRIVVCGGSGSTPVPTGRWATPSRCNVSTGAYPIESQVGRRQTAESHLRSSRTCATSG